MNMTPITAMPVVWTLAGSDPSGGAGIQADLKVFQSLGVYGCTALSMVIAQNTQGVQAAESVNPRLFDAQVQSLAEDIPPAAVKTGALGSAENIGIAARHLAKLRVPLVCDPVLGPTTGVPFLPPPGVDALRHELLPLATLLTPNLPEASRILGKAPLPPEAIPEAAELLRGCGPRAVLIKGGHAGGTDCRDYFSDGETRCWLISPRQRVQHTHGTGCTLSSAITAYLARGEPLLRAVEWGKAYLNQGLRLGGGIGKGLGPLAHVPPQHIPADYPVITPVRLME